MKQKIVLQESAPKTAGGFNAAVIDGKVHVTTWHKGVNGDSVEITVVLTASELFQLRYFCNQVIDAAMSGGENPSAFFAGRS